MATLEEDKVATPEVKHEPASTNAHPSNDMANSESQLNNKLSNSDTQPNKGPTISETQATSEEVNAGTLPNYELASSEELPNDQPINSEAPPNNQPVISEAPLTNRSLNSEAPPDKQLVSSEAPLDKNPAPEAPPSNELVNSEALPNNGMINSETQTSNEVILSETQPGNEAVLSETQPGNEAVLSETQPGNEAVLSETQPGIEAVCCKEAVLSETQPGNEAVLSETQPGNEAVLSETQPGNEAVLSDTQPGNEAVMSETQTTNEAVMSETQTGSEAVMSETQPGYEVVMSETQTGNEVVMSETQTGNEVVMSETRTSNEVVMSEALPGNELANSVAHPNYQLSHSETLPDNQFTHPHMLPENQLPHCESLPNSEPLADNNLTDTKPILHNQPAHFETHPNNHLANHEGLSHDQLGNTQSLPHYELENSETQHGHQLVNSQTHYELVNSDTLPRYEIVSAESQPNNYEIVSAAEMQPKNYEIVNAGTQPNNYEIISAETQPNNYEIVSAEAQPNNYEIVSAETQPNNEEHTPETQPNKRRKKKSIVWEHFTIETVSAGCRRACCKQCKQSFAYSTGSKVAGTSHLKRHIAKGTCPALLRNQQQNQLTPYTPRSRGSGAGSTGDTPKRRYRSPSTPYIIFDQDRCRHEIARMIIMHDYPLHMVEHPGFVAFVQNLQPQFNMVTFNTVQGDCVATYLMEKQNLMKYFEGLPGRVCLTLDMWSSSQSVGYVFITGHFVDSDWKLQRRILNVVMEPYPDSDSALNHAVAACLSDWSLEGRLFSITFNQAMSEVALENLRPLLSVKNPLILNGQLLVGDCIARTLSNVAMDLLGSARDIVKKIRDSVKYVKTSESHEEKFLELKQQLQVPSDRSLFIDDQTQWNTTYQMLVAACELKEVFSCLDTSDPDYKGAPSMQDWKLVETLCTYLKPLFDAANILTTTTHPTAITFYHEVWKLQLDLARAVMSEDPFISNLSKIMQEKIDKYWRDCCLVLAVAVVMDPRFKMKLVEFSFSKIYGEDSHAYIKIVDDGIHEMFHEYVALPLPLTPAYAEEGGAGGHMKMEDCSGGTLLSDNGLTDFDVYIMETTSQQMKSELDQYLEESLLPRVPDFDVLGWWKLNKMKYPTLSKMARDILSVPVSTVPSDSVFDTKSKEMDQYRSSLRPETVEALVCAKDWMQYGAAEASNALVKTVF